MVDPDGSLNDKQIGQGFLILALALFLLIAIVANPQPPRFIGIGCEGSGGDIWAMEESDFPTNCKIIEEYK